MTALKSLFNITGKYTTPDGGISSSNQSHYRPEVPREFQEVKVPRLRDNGPRWW